MVRQLVTDLARPRRRHRRHVTLVIVLRVSGKRTLAKLNAFDLVVTVAPGSTLSSMVLTTSVSWVQGTVALVLLAALQFVVAEVSRHLPRGRDVVTARPALLLRDGELLADVLAHERVTDDELRQAVHAQGHGGLGHLASVVVETDAAMSVIPRNSLADGRAMQGVRDAQTLSSQ